MGIGIAIGLTIAIFMAATQLQEQSLQFVPKDYRHRNDTLGGGALDARYLRCDLYCRHL